MINRIKQFIITHSALGLAIVAFIIIFLTIRFYGASVDFFRAQYEADRLQWKGWTELMCKANIMEANAFNDLMINQISFNCNKYVSIVNHSTDQYIFDLALFNVLLYAGYFAHLVLYHYVISAVITSVVGIAGYLFFPRGWLFAKKKVE